MISDEEMGTRTQALMTFFEGRTTEQLLHDLYFLAQLTSFRHHMEKHKNPLAVLLGLLNNLERDTNLPEDVRKCITPLRDALMKAGITP